MRMHVSYDGTAYTKSEKGVSMGGESWEGSFYVANKEVDGGRESSGPRKHVLSKALRE